MVLNQLILVSVMPKVLNCLLLFFHFDEIVGDSGSKRHPFSWHYSSLKSVKQRPEVREKVGWRLFVHFNDEIPGPCSTIFLMFEVSFE